MSLFTCVLFCERKHIFPLIYLGAELLGHRAGVHLALVEIAKQFFLSGYPRDTLVLVTFQ